MNSIEENLRQEVIRTSKEYEDFVKLHLVEPSVSNTHNISIKTKEDIKEHDRLSENKRKASYNLVSYCNKTN